MLDVLYVIDTKYIRVHSNMYIGVFSFRLSLTYFPPLELRWVVTCKSEVITRLYINYNLCVIEVYEGQVLVQQDDAQNVQN